LENFKKIDKFVLRSLKGKKTLSLILSLKNKPGVYGLFIKPVKG